MVHVQKKKKVIFQQTFEKGIFFFNLNDQTHASKTRQNYTLRSQIYERRLEGTNNKELHLLRQRTHQAML